ncbi:MAG: hypothetical protein QGD90_04755 [Candidatus Hydrogenedentes bacterium]|nr:hypothetical protein [Candidatus Hydrogenedentota bacterium]
MQERTPTQRAALTTSGVIFAIGAIAHGVRLATGFEIVIGGVVGYVGGYLNAADRYR